MEDMDRWNWPNSPSMTAGEIVRFQARMTQFQALGMADAERLADALVLRDRDMDTRTSCLECASVRRGLRCDWLRQPICQDEAVQLQRCDGFKGAINGR